MVHNTIKRAMPMSTIDDEIAAYDAMRQDLESNHMGKWVLFHGGELAGTFETFEATAEEAVRRFGRGPYLIRQVGAPPLVLPASVMYNPAHYGSS